MSRETRHFFLRCMMNSQALSHRRGWAREVDLTIRGRDVPGTGAIPRVPDQRKLGCDILHPDRATTGGIITVWKMQA